MLDLRLAMLVIIILYFYHSYARPSKIPVFSFHTENINNAWARQTYFPVTCVLFSGVI